MEASIHIGWIIGALTLLVAIVGAAISIGQWKGRLDAEREETKRNVLGLHRTLEGFVSEIRSDIKQIFKSLSPSVLTSGSPLRLTELGRKISDSINGATLAEEFAESLRNQVAGKLPYEIQEMAMAHVKETWTPSEEVDRRIKSVAYENGLKREQVLDVIAIELRDKLLQEEKS